MTASDEGSPDLRFHCTTIHEEGNVKWCQDIRPTKVQDREPVMRISAAALEKSQRYTAWKMRGVFAKVLTISVIIPDQIPPAKETKINITQHARDNQVHLPNEVTERSAINTGTQSDLWMFQILQARKSCIGVEIETYKTPSVPDYMLAGNISPLSWWNLYSMLLWITSHWWNV